MAKREKLTVEEMHEYLAIMNRVIYADPDLDAASYAKYRQSREWLAKRQEIMRRANQVCEKCGKGGLLHVHHLTYQRIYNECLDDLIALCPECHADIHGISTRHSATPRRV